MRYFSSLNPLLISRTSVKATIAMGFPIRHHKKEPGVALHCDDMESEQTERVKRIVQ